MMQLFERFLFVFLFFLVWLRNALSSSAQKHALTSPSLPRKL